MKKLARSFQRGFFPTTVRVLALALAVMLSAGVASAQTQAYVTDQATGAVLVYDASTYAFVTSISVSPGTPNRIAVTPDQAFAYVTLSDTNQVAVIDTATNALVTTVGVGGNPQGLAVTPDGAFVYVANSASSGALSVISTATNTVVATVFLASPAYGVAITPDGASVYATLPLADSVEVIDTATNSPVNTVPMLGPSSHPAITPDGAFVYVATVAVGLGPSDTYVISTATNTIVATIAGPSAFDVAITPNGASAYVTPVTFGIPVIDTATNTVSTTIPFLAVAPAGIEIQPGGAFAWVAHGLTGSVDLFATATNTPATSIATGGQPVDIAFVVKTPAGPTSKEQCKNGGWATFTNPTFMNQGQCIAYVNQL